MTVASLAPMLVSAIVAVCVGLWAGGAYAANVGPKKQPGPFELTKAQNRSSAYRDDPNNWIQPWQAKRFAWWRWALCKLTLGHRWRITRTNIRKANALATLHPRAGCDATCEKCGATWLDAEWFSAHHLDSQDIIDEEIHARYARIDEQVLERLDRGPKNGRAP